MSMSGHNVDSTGSGSAGENPLVVADNENISEVPAGSGESAAAVAEKGSGWWRQCLFVRNGRRVPANWRDAASRWSAAAPLFELLLTAANSSQGGLGVAERLPKGSIEYSMLGPGAHLKAHCGPSNHRLRLHLPIVLPPVEGGERAKARMRVGDEASASRAWVAGKVSVFDDSYVSTHATLTTLDSQGYSV